MGLKNEKKALETENKTLKRKNKKLKKTIKDLTWYADLTANVQHALLEVNDIKVVDNFHTAIEEIAEFRGRKEDLKPSNTEMIALRTSLNAIYGSVHFIFVGKRPGIEAE